MTQNTRDNRLNAKLLKEIVSKFLLDRDPHGIIGYEIMYGSSRRVADIVFISRGHTYAIEIKSEFDTIYRLSGQLFEYQTLFDYVIVFSSKNHLDSIKTTIPNHIGLYVVSDSCITKVQGEKKNPNVQKQEMLISIPASVVRTKFSIKGKLSSDEIRSKALCRSRKVIHDFFIEYLTIKLSMRIDSDTTCGQQLSSDKDVDFIIL